MTTYRIRFEGPAALVLRVATALADADGVELVSSQPPSGLGEGGVALDVEAEGTPDAVSGALDRIRQDLPADASIDIVAD